MGCVLHCLWLFLHAGQNLTYNNKPIGTTLDEALKTFLDPKSPHKIHTKSASVQLSKRLDVGVKRTVSVFDRIYDTREDDLNGYIDAAPVLESDDDEGGADATGKYSAQSQTSGQKAKTKAQKKEEKAQQMQNKAQQKRERAQNQSAKGKLDQSAKRNSNTQGGVLLNSM